MAPNTPVTKLTPPRNRPRNEHVPQPTRRDHYRRPQRTDTILEVLRATSNTALVSAHIQEVFTKLPRGHPLRQLFADACVKSWLIKTEPSSSSLFPLKWDFDREEKLEGFASDLLKAVGRSRKYNKGDTHIITTDPISGHDFMYK